MSFSKQFPTRILLGLLDPQHALLSIKMLAAAWPRPQHHIPDDLTPHTPASLFYFLKFTHIRSSSFTSIKVSILEACLLTLFISVKQRLTCLTGNTGSLYYITSHIHLPPERFMWQQVVQCDCKLLQCSMLLHSALNRGQHVLVQCFAVNIRFFFAIFPESARNVFLWLPDVQHVWHYCSWHM